MARTNKRTSWTVQEVTEFRAWHESRMEELNYPEHMRIQLRRDRDKFLPTPSDK